MPFPLREHGPGCDALNATDEGEPHGTGACACVSADACDETCDDACDDACDETCDDVWADGCAADCAEPCTGGRAQEGGAEPTEPRPAPRSEQPVDTRGEVASRLSIWEAVPP
jgi:hypothetical protein